MEKPIFDSKQFDKKSFKLRWGRKKVSGISAFAFSDTKGVFLNHQFTAFVSVIPAWVAEYLIRPIIDRRNSEQATYHRPHLPGRFLERKVLFSRKCFDSCLFSDLSCNNMHILAFLLLVFVIEETFRRFSLLILCLRNILHRDSLRFYSSDTQEIRAQLQL